MKIYAIYRMYYGEDFIEASIQSIYDHVTKIFVFASPHAYGRVQEGRVDQSISIVRNIRDNKKKIMIIENEKHWETPIDQFTNLYNTYIYKEYSPADAIMCIEPDMIWEIEELENYFITLSLLSKDRSLIADQVEFWHNHHWRIPSRARKTLITHKLNLQHSMPKTDRSGHRTRGSMVTSSRQVYNYGFCLSPKNMKMKCDLGIAYSKIIGDSIPNPDWYEYRWLKWHPATNNKNLEISSGYEHLIPCAESTSIKTPEVLKDHQWNPNIFIQALKQSSGDTRIK